MLDHVPMPQREAFADREDIGADLFAALCLVGQLRTGVRNAHATDHWMQQASFAHRLMAGTPSWHGLHAVLASDATLIDLEWTAHTIQQTFKLPVHNVHTVQTERTTEANVEHRCGNVTSSAKWCGRKSCGGLQKQYLSFYAQWGKAAACFDRVTKIERMANASSMVRDAARFKFVIKMRTDWPFLDAPPMIGMQVAQPISETLVYARFRCAPLIGILSPIFFSQNTHLPRAINAGCPPGVALLDDQFVIAPRSRAEALFSAASLPCPHRSESVQRDVVTVCGGYAISECFLHIHLRSAVDTGPKSFHVGFRQAIVAPIAVTWGDLCNFPALMEGGASNWAKARCRGRESRPEGAILAPHRLAESTIYRH